MEKLFASGSSPERPSLHTEQIVAEMQEVLTECRHDPASPRCDVELLHGHLSHADFSPVFRDYENHTIMNLADVQQSIALVVSALDSELAEWPADSSEYQFIRERYNLLQSRADTVAAAVRQYVATVARFHHISRQQLRLEPEEFSHQMQTIDANRRRNHDHLIDTLKIYTKAINELKREGYLDQVVVEEWEHGVTSGDSAGSTVYTFSGNFLRDRDLVRDWALSVHAHTVIDKITRMQKEHDSGEG